MGDIETGPLGSNKFETLYMLTPENCDKGDMKLKYVPIVIAPNVKPCPIFCLRTPPAVPCQIILTQITVIPELSTFRF